MAFVAPSYVFIVLLWCRRELSLFTTGGAGGNGHVASWKDLVVRMYNILTPNINAYAQRACLLSLQMGVWTRHD
jgi:hypothetical protein